LISSGFPKERLASRPAARRILGQESNFTCAKLSPLARRARPTPTTDKQAPFAEQMLRQPLASLAAGAPSGEKLNFFRIALQQPRP
jgi:hypothetical protein